MKKIFIVASMSLAAVANAAGFYGGIGYGVSSVAEDIDDFNTNMVSMLGGQINSTQSKAINNLRLIGGYKFNENVAMEMGYVQTSKLSLTFTGTDRNSTAYNGKANASFSGLDVAVVLRPNVASGYNGLFGTIGMHNYKVKRSLSFNYGGTTSTENSSDSGTGALFGVGYDWKVDKNLDMRLSVTRLKSVGGDSESNATNFTIGLLKNF